MNLKLAFGVLFFSSVTIATLALGIIFLEKVYMVTLKKSFVLVTVAMFIFGATVGAYIQRRNKKVRPWV